MTGQPEDGLQIVGGIPQQQALIVAAHRRVCAAAAVAGAHVTAGGAPGGALADAEPRAAAAVLGALEGLLAQNTVRYDLTGGWETSELPGIYVGLQPGAGGDGVIALQVCGALWTLSPQAAATERMLAQSIAYALLQACQAPGAAQAAAAGQSPVAAAPSLWSSATFLADAVESTKPVVQGFTYTSDAGSPVTVCALDGSAGLVQAGFTAFPAQAGTLAVWVRSTSTQAGATLFSYAPPTGTPGATLTVANLANLQVSLDGATTGPTGVAANDGLWHQVVVTYRRIPPGHYAVGLYLDSLQLYFARGGVAATAALVVGGTLQVGYGGSAGTGLVGDLSELQVYNAVLDAGAIATGLMRRAVDGAPGLVLHWPLDVPPPGNDGARMLPSDLCFRTGSATVTWQPVTPPPTAYEVRVGSIDGIWTQGDDQVSGTSYSPPDTPLNRALTAQVRTGGTQPGPWSDPAPLTAFELGRPALTQTWDATAQTLTAAWPDVAQRTSFTLAMYQGSSPNPTVTPGYTQTSYDLTARLDDPSAWRLDVRAVAGGVSGPASLAVRAAAPRLQVLYDSVQKQLSCTWDPVAGAQYWRLRIAPQSGGQQPYALTLPAAQTSAVVPDAQYPLQQGVTYQVGLRVLGGGTLGDWAQVNLQVHDVAAPTLSWSYAAAADTLAAQWSEVSGGDTYNLSLYKVGQGTPVDTRTGLTDRTYAMGAYLGSADAYRVLVAAVDGGVQGPTNQPAAPGALEPAFHYLVSDETLTVDWTAQPNAYLRVLRDGGQTVALKGWYTTPAAQASFPAPLAEYPAGTALTLGIRGLTPGYLGAVSAAQLVVRTLAKPVPTLAYDPAGPTLTASWPAINPELTVAYQQQKTIAGQAQPVQDLGGASSVITPLLSVAGTVQVCFRGLADGSIGPWSDVAPAPAVTGVTLQYDEVSSRLTVGWDAVSGVETLYVEAWQDGGSAPLVRAWLAGNAGGTVLDLPSSSAGQQVTVKVRSVNGPSFSDFTSAAMTLAHVPGPVLKPLTDHVNPNSIDANWTFAAAGGTTCLGYVAELYRGETRLVSRPLAGAGSTSTTFSDGISTGVTYRVQVRAQVQLSAGREVLGAWSQSQTVTVGSGDLALRSLSVTSNDKGDLTVSWVPAQTISGVTFTVQVTGADYGGYTKKDLTGTRVDLGQSETGVTTGNTYAVTAWAVLNGSIEGPKSAQSVVAGKPQRPVDPDHPQGGDPVDLSTGAFTYSNLDLGVPGAAALALITHYRSDTPLPTDNPGLPSTPVGARWNHSYNTRIQKAGDGKTAAVIWGSGTVVVYGVPPSVTGYYPQQGVPCGDVLFVGSDLHYRLTRRDQSVLDFSPQGALLSIQTPHGQMVNLTYDQARLRRVTDAGSGRYLQFTYDGNGRIQTVTTSTGAAIGYRFDPTGNLLQYTDPRGKSRTFAYDGASRMLTAQDQNGQVYVKNTYDQAGRVQFQQDARAIAGGHAYGTTFAYALAGDVLTVTVTGRVGQVTTYTINNTTRLMRSQVTDLGAGQVHRVIQTHDGNGNVVTRSEFQGAADSQAAGNTWTNTYDGNNNCTGVTDPLGGVVRNLFNEKNQCARHTDRLGNVTAYGYQGNLLHTITDPLGRVSTIAWVVAGSNGWVPRSLTDPWGNVTTYAFGADGQPTQITDPTSNVITLGYNNQGFADSTAISGPDGVAVYTETRQVNGMGWVGSRAVTYRDQPAHTAFTTVLGHDDDGNLTAITDPLGHTAQYVYNPNNLLQSILYPVSTGPAPKTEFTYDQADRLTGRDRGAGDVTAYTYDALDRVLTETSPNGDVTRHAYTMVAVGGQPWFNWVQTTTLPLTVDGHALQTQVVADPLGRVSSWTNPRALATTFAYTAVAQGQTHGLRVTATLPPTAPGQAPYTVSRTADALGRPVEQVDEAGHRTTYSYAAASTVSDPPPGAAYAVTTTKPTGNQQVALHDGRGHLLQVRRGGGADLRTQTFTHDPLGRVVQAVQAGGGATYASTYAYAYSDGGLTLTTTPFGQAGPHFRFDPLGQMLQATDPAGGVLRYTYTPRRQMATYTNARGQTLTYGYDAAGRLTGTTLPGDAGSITHRLDGNGNRLQTLRSGTPQVSRTFDALDRLLSRTDELAQQTVAYSYGNLEAVATLTYPAADGEQRQVIYSYDGPGRMTGLRDWAGRTAAFTWTPTGMLQGATLPGGVKVACTVDDDGRLIRRSTRVGADVVADARYGYNAFDEVQTLVDILPAPAAPPAGTQSFTYSHTRLTKAGDTAVHYDADGNMTSLPGLSGTLAYDVFNNVTAAGDRQFTFDVDGLRTGVIAGQQSRSYARDIAGYENPWREQADPIRGTVGTVAQHLRTGGSAPAPVQGGPGPVPLPGALDRVLVQTEGTDRTWYVHGPELVGAEAPDGSFCTYVLDGQGSTLALVGREGILTVRHAYDWFGGQIGGDAPTQPFGYVGGYGVMTDQPGLLYMRARSYAPGLLRFTGQDYLLGADTDPLTWNRYLYTGDNPILQVDPLGEDRVWTFVLGGVVLGVFALLGGLAVASALGAFGGAAVGGTVVGGTVVGGAVGGGTVGGGTVGGGTAGSGGSNVFSRFSNNVRYRGRGRYTRLPTEDPWEVELQDMSQTNKTNKIKTD